MIHISDEEFTLAVSQAVAQIPERFASHLENVAFLTEDQPSHEQRVAAGLIHSNQTLLGLYQGVPLPKRNNGYSGASPDVITVFKRPHEYASHDLEDLRKRVHQTIWHEVAHYFGLDHEAISALED